MDSMRLAGARRSLDEQKVFLVHVADFFQRFKLAVVECVRVATDKTLHIGLILLHYSLALTLRAHFTAGVHYSAQSVCHGRVLLSILP
mmetsp:Transcript_6518/g.8802  ORF Transcript_6518/g.8802 Transcript_6518/m.8802 type:complete len:88 (-) Transcript_6518:569-832(-)